METVLEYRIPVLHPFAVHLPVTLLLTAAVAALIWMFRGTALWRRCCLFLLLLSTPAAAFAYFTGDEMQERAEGVPIVDELVGLHELMALITLLFTAAVTLLFGIYDLRIERGKRQADPVEGKMDPVERMADPVERMVNTSERTADPVERMADPVERMADPVERMADPAERQAHQVERKVDPIASRVAVSLLVFLAAALVAWTAHIGATMTWGVAR